MNPSENPHIRFIYIHSQISQVVGNAPHFSPLLGALRPPVAPNFTLCPLLVESYLTHLGMHEFL